MSLILKVSYFFGFAFLDQLKYFLIQKRFIQKRSFYLFLYCLLSLLTSWWYVVVCLKQQVRLLFACVANTNKLDLMSFRQSFSPSCHEAPPELPHSSQTWFSEVAGGFGSTLRRVGRLGWWLSHQDSELLLMTSTENTQVNSWHMHWYKCINYILLYTYAYFILFNLRHGKSIILDFSKSIHFLLCPFK